MSDKTSPHHLERQTYVYVRQSTNYQVRNHREGQQRQYALADRARQLGFARVAVLDEDLGRSGRSSQDRPGFGRLLAAVCQGQVGAVLEDGVYDPRLVNDRPLLGLK
jgi:DNA invertase Pin-like site-specific DNA recombinase